MGEVAKIKGGDMMALIERVACDPNADVSKLEKMLDMQERIFDKNAEISFNQAMTACQAEMPTVARDAENKQTNSRYAKYETIIKTARPCYTKHGFALSFGQGENPSDKHIRVTCDVSHNGGHVRHYFIDMALDDAGIKGVTNKTEVHARGSSFSYAKRYLFCMIFNIPIADEDDDGVKAGGVTVENLLEHMHLVRELFDVVSAIKIGIANENWDDAAIAWCSLEVEQKSALWKAPSKGGIFTTREREIMREPSFQDACRALSVNGTGGDAA